MLLIFKNWLSIVLYSLINGVQKGGWLEQDILISFTTYCWSTNQNPRLPTIYPYKAIDTERLTPTLPCLACALCVYWYEEILARIKVWIGGISMTGYFPYHQDLPHAKKKKMQKLNAAIIIWRSVPTSLHVLFYQKASLASGVSTLAKKRVENSHRLKATEKALRHKTKKAGNAISSIKRRQSIKSMQRGGRMQHMPCLYVQLS